MAALRKFKCYRRVKRAYTRKSKFKSKSFVKGVPNIKLVKFDMGNIKGKYDTQLNLSTKEPVQIRHNALESARTVVNRQLHKNLGENYYLKIRVYPHHVLRENKLLTGAGADRMQSGMKHSFGKPIGSAAQLKQGQTIFSLAVDKKNVQTARTALRFAFSRLPCRCNIEIARP